ncbi:hypothetical protein CLU79DRAFT_758019, partial [Phycomyces nitens]
MFLFHCIFILFYFILLRYHLYYFACSKSQFIKQNKCVSINNACFLAHWTFLTLKST